MSERVYRRFSLAEIERCCVAVVCGAVPSGVSAARRAVVEAQFRAHATDFFEAVMAALGAEGCRDTGRVRRVVGLVLARMRDSERAGALVGVAPSVGRRGPVRR